MNKLANAIDRINDRLGRVVAWAGLVMVVTGVAVVLLRYGFDQGSAALQESMLWLNGILILLGAAYALRHDAHVRVDVWHRRLSMHGQAWVNLAGTLLLLWPFCAVLFWFCLDYVIASWKIHEGSQETGGLPGIFLLKTLLLIMPLLLALQGLAMALRSVHQLRGTRQ